MIARTNPFDHLSSAIVAATAGKDLCVEETVLKRGLTTRQPREIEILVSRGNGMKLFLVNCRAYTRAQGVMWIEQLDDKRLSLGFECVLAVSRSGFSMAAKNEAAARGIETALLTEAASADWSSWMFNIPSILVKHGRSTLSPEPYGLLKSCRRTNAAA